MRNMESLYSSKSSNFSALHRRKAAAARQPAIVIASSSDVRHRVMSARMLRFKQLQNQLEVAHHQIAVSAMFVFLSSVTDDLTLFKLHRN